MIITPRDVLVFRRWLRSHGCVSQGHGETIVGPRRLTRNRQLCLCSTCVGMMLSSRCPLCVKGPFTSDGASNPFPPCFDSLWPPDGAARAPKTCDYREGLLAALTPDLFCPRNCNITTLEADDSSFSKQTQSLGQECTAQPAKITGQLSLGLIF